MFNNIKIIFSQIINFFRETNKINSFLSITNISSIINTLSFNDDYTNVVDGLISFYSNSNIKEINFPLFRYCRTSNYLFENCKTVYSYAFENNESLISIELPNCNWIKGQGFQNCQNLTNIILPQCLKLGPYVFASCYNLSFINLPLCSIIDSNDFFDCNNLETIIAPSCIVISTQAFINCTSLNSIGFPNVTSIDVSAFTGCTSLSSIDFPEVTTINSGAFASCTSLSSINFPKATSVSSNAFIGCPLTFINFPQCNPAINFPSNIEYLGLGTTTISSSRFKDYSYLTSANFPYCVTVGSGAFVGCHNLSQIKLPNCFTIHQNAFMGTSLSFIMLPSCNIISYAAFANISSLSIVALSELCSIGTYVFRSCNKLISLYLFSNGLYTLSNIDAFYSTPISTYSAWVGRYGSIFVPSGLLTTYQSATNWATYSSRFATIEDNPLPSEFTS